MQRLALDARELVGRRVDHLVVGEREALYRVRLSRDPETGCSMRPARRIRSHDLLAGLGIERDADDGCRFRLATTKTRRSSKVTWRASSGSANTSMPPGTAARVSALTTSSSAPNRGRTSRTQTSIEFAVDVEDSSTGTTQRAVARCATTSAPTRRIGDRADGCSPTLFRRGGRGDDREAAAECRQRADRVQRAAHRSGSRCSAVSTRGVMPAQRMFGAQ